MKRRSFIAFSILVFIAILSVSAHAGLDIFLSDLNAQARADIKSFGTRLSVQFGVPIPQIQSIMKTVELPGDAFMCLELSRMTDTQLDEVVSTYKRNKRKGWGAIAKELGIKPGSSEFKALKRGQFKLAGEPDKKTDKGKNKGKGKGKGRKK